MGLLSQCQTLVPGRHVPVAAVPLAAHGRAGLAEVAVDDVGELSGGVRAEVLSGRGVHPFLVHDAAGVEAVNDACLKLLYRQMSK